VSAQPYKKPPITEAVIEIRLAAPLDAAELAKTSSDFRAYYPLEQSVKNVGVALGLPSAPEGKPTAQINEENGYRRNSLDLTELIVLWRRAFSISQLAPYPGWEAFFTRFRRDWGVWKQRLGYRTIARIGVRYINRIDIPLPGNEPVIEEAEYLNVYPHFPKELGPTMAYGVQAVLPLADIDSKLTLNSSIVPSPLLGHAAFLFDQDVAREQEPPQRDEDIFDLLNQIRDRKNSVFEACITDRTRELFQR
jgi:uncharacterized protein (TIGR04255 family)